MKITAIIFLFLIVFVLNPTEADEESEEDSYFKPKFPTNLEETKSFKKFVELVEKHQLNVSIIISKTEKWNSGSTKDIVALSLTPFPNDVYLTTSQLDRKTVQEFVDMAEADHLPATAILLSEDPDVDTVTVRNNPYGEIIDYNLRAITTLKNEDRVNTILNGATDIAGHITMKLPNDSLTKIFFGNLQVTVIDSNNIEPSDLSKMKHYVNETLFEFEDEDVPRALVAWMDQKYPEDNNWQATDNADYGFLVDAKKYAIFKTVIGTYAVFTS